MKTLLIWELIPEATKVYLIPDAGSWIETAHRRYINGTENTDEQDAALNRISDALSSKLDYCMDPEDSIATQWVQYELPYEDVNVIEGEFRVIQCGFVL